MGEVEINKHSRQLIIHSVLFFYGNAASDSLSLQIAKDIADHWNEADALVKLSNETFRVYFDIEGIWARQLTPAMVFENTNARNNYFRIEEYAEANISFVDGLGCNTGYFKLDNLLNNSTTAAHEYGHTLGLDHPHVLDIRGKGVPGIMYPRGTVVDASYQYNPHGLAGDNTNGGTMNPFTRKVLPEDVEALDLHKLRFDKNGFAVVGEFSSVWHDAHEKR